MVGCHRQPAPRGVNGCSAGDHLKPAEFTRRYRQRHAATRLNCQPIELEQNAGDALFVQQWLARNAICQNNRRDRMLVEMDRHQPHRTGSTGSLKVLPINVCKGQKWTSSRNRSNVDGDELVGASYLCNW
jgi:hypothetical protein